MKKLVMLILIGLWMYGVHAQTLSTTGADEPTTQHQNEKVTAAEAANIPLPAKTHFSATHGNAEKPKWNKEQDGSYRTTYTVGNTPHTAHYSKSGRWIADERHLREQHVPLPILDAFRYSRYQYGQVKTYSYITNDQYAQGVYVLTVMLQGKQTCLYYNAAGDLIRTF